jgi:phosphopantothenoylcysteine decarboxylase/phosphopantothenate--cysteine ligase
LITSGPTREHLDPVRYLSNASSGQMGSCLAAAALDAGYDVTIVSGPVDVNYPSDAEVIRVVSTAQMRDAVVEHWAGCVGMIAAAAPADFRPKSFSDSKIKKVPGKSEMTIQLVENPDILAEVGRMKSGNQWTIGFALETENGIERATAKLDRKNCDLIILNGVSAIDSADNSVALIDSTGTVVQEISGSKTEVAEAILKAAIELLPLS